MTIYRNYVSKTRGFFLKNKSKISEVESNQLIKNDPS